MSKKKEENTLEKKDMGKKFDVKTYLTKKNIIIAVSIFVVLVIAIVIIVLNFSNKQEQPAPEQESVGLIDMTNKENVNIYGTTKENVSEALKQERISEELKLKEIQLKAEKGITKFSAVVENMSETDYAGGVKTIVFLDKEGKELASLQCYIPAIKTGSKNSIHANSTADLANAYDFNIR